MVGRAYFGSRNRELLAALKMQKSSRLEPHFRDTITMILHL
jgi:hypothetical protein